MVKNSPCTEGIWVESLVWEDPTGCGATKPVLQSPGATAAEARGPSEACEPSEACKPSLVLSNKRSHRSEKPRPCNWRVDPPHLN